MDKITAPKGVYAAVATPVDSGLRPDRARYLDHCRWLLDNGCSGLAPLGTTGEAASLGLAVKTELIDVLHGSGLPMDRMIIGTGSTSIDDTVTLSETALEAGTAGLLMLPPFYYSDPSEDGLFRYFVSIADRLSHRRPQIFLYHIPMYTGVAVTTRLTARLRAAFPGIFVGLKDSGGDFACTLKFLKAFPGFAAFSGTEVFAMRNLIAGGWGCISATANFTAPAVARRISGTSGDAAALDRTIEELRNRVSAKGTVSGTKAYLALHKNDPEWRRTLPPNTAAVDGILPLPELFDRLQPIDELRKLYGDAIIH